MEIDASIKPAFHMSSFGGTGERERDFHISLIPDLEKNHPENVLGTVISRTH